MNCAHRQLMNIKCVRQPSAVGFWASQNDYVSIVIFELAAVAVSGTQCIQWRHQDLHPGGTTNMFTQKQAYITGMHT